VTDALVTRGNDLAAPKKPALPWVSVVLVDPARRPPWAGGFERCLAWAWLDSAAASKQGET
jgi:hypothetical protein